MAAPAIHAGSNESIRSGTCRRFRWAASCKTTMAICSCVSSSTNRSLTSRLRKRGKKPATIALKLCWFVSQRTGRVPLAPAAVSKSHIQDSVSGASGLVLKSLRIRIGNPTKMNSTIIVPIRSDPAPSPIGSKPTKSDSARIINTGAINHPILLRNRLHTIAKWLFRRRSV